MKYILASTLLLILITLIACASVQDNMQDSHSRPKAKIIFRHLVEPKFPAG